MTRSLADQDDFALLDAIRGIGVNRIATAAAADGISVTVAGADEI